MGRYTSSTICCYSNSRDLGVSYHHGCGSYKQFTVSVPRSEASASIFVLRSQEQQQQQRRSAKKRVRFADDEGGLLCSIKIFEESHFVYQPRPHATTDFTSKTKLTNYRVVYNETKLYLKQICVVAYGLLGDTTLFGAIAVRNVSFEKKIFVRLTLDGWKTSSDVPAKFVQQEYEGCIDRFFFTNAINEGSFQSLAPNIEFAVCYSANQKEHWDNNGGENFRFIPLAPGE